MRFVNLVSPVMEDQQIWLRLFGSPDGRGTDRARIAGAMYSFDHGAKHGTNESDRVSYFQYLDIERAKQSHRVLMRTLHTQDGRIA